MKDLADSGIVEDVLLVNLMRRELKVNSDAPSQRSRRTENLMRRELKVVLPIEPLPLLFRLESHEERIESLQLGHQGLEGLQALRIS